MEQKPKRILILGGGYVAIFACRALKRAIARAEVDVTVVSRENYHVWHGYVSEMITGRIAAGQILSPARRIFSPAKVHVAEIEQIDLKNRKVVTSRHLDGRQYELEYDELILSLGSTENYDAYPGLQEHGFRLKSYDDCFRLKNHILRMFEMADIETDPAERQRLLTFFIAGGGYAGTELAGELADYIRLLTSREYRGIRRDECRVILVHSGPTILPELYGSKSGGASGYGFGYPRLVEYATRHLERLGVEVMTDTKVTYATPNEVGLSGGQRISTRTIVSAVGTRPAPILDTIDVPRGDRGRVATEKTLQVTGVDHIWSGGDCAAVPHRNGGTCPPVGLFAMQMGEQIGKNILRKIRGKRLTEFTWPGLGQAVSIGGRTAVGELKGIEFKGLFCWLMWRAMSFYYFPSWDRKLRLLSDWIIWPLVGRDIVEMSVEDSDDYEISHHLFQPGEVILEAEQVGRYLYLITDGQVEQVKPSGEPTTLGTGSYFGHTLRGRKSPEMVRAKTVVHAVTVRADQAHKLQKAIAALDQVVAVGENR
jgi:NADH dehydrogenase